MAYSSEENGIVERSNKETWRWIRTILHDKQLAKEQVTKVIPFVTRLHNTTVVKSLGYSPAQIIFGERVDIDRSILLPKEAVMEGVQSTTEWMNHQRILQNKVLSTAARLQKEHDERNIVKRAFTDGEHPVTDFPIGSYVLLAYPKTDYGQRRPNKTFMMYKGPYKVLGRINNEITLENLISHEEFTKPIFHLRPFHYDPTRTDPAVLAVKDCIDECRIEKIVAHQGDWKRIRQMTFTVKWADQDETYNTNESWDTLRQTDQLHEYLQDQGHGDKIPKDFQ